MNGLINFTGNVTYAVSDYFRDYTIKEVIRDFCGSIPRVFFTGILVIFSFYIVSYNILPRLRKHSANKKFISGVQRLEDILDTFGYMICLYFMYMGFTSKVGLWFNVWSVILLIVLLLSAIDNVYKFVIDLVKDIIIEWKK